MTSSPSRPQPRSQPPAPTRSSVVESRRLAKEAARKKQTLIGIVTVTVCLVFLVSLLVYWQVSEANATEARTAIEREQTALQEEIARFDLNDAAQAQQAVQRLVQSQPQWEQWPAAARFTDLLGKVRFAAEAARKRQSLNEAVAQLEQQVAAHPPDATSWQTMLDRARSLVEQAKSGTAEDQQRVKACLGTIEDGYFAAVRAAIAAAAGDPQTARRMIAAAEQLAEAKLEAATQSRDAAAKTHWEQELLAYAKQENTSLAASYTAEAIGKVAWQDLLPGTSTADWVHSSSSGLGHTVSAETIQIDGPDASAKGNGVVVLRDRAFRNCEIEFDATLLRGAATILLRAGKKADPKLSAAVRFVLAEAPKAVLLPAGQPVHIDMLVLGDRLTVRVGDQKHESAIPARARNGGLAIVTEPGTSLSISRLRVRNLE